MSKDTVRTLDDMNKFFESRGIKVKREYDRVKKRYDFRLSRDNCMVVYHLYYPTTDDREERYSQMTSYCNEMLESFDQYCKEYSVKIPDTVEDYVCHGVNVSKRVANEEPKELYFPWDIRTVKKVIFNDPATIVFWSDGSKTVVKCSFNDIYDPEKGMAMAFVKKMFGNDNSFHKLFTKWLPKEEPTIVEIKLLPNTDNSEAIEQVETLQQKLYRALGYVRKKENNNGN